MAHRYLGLFGISVVADCNRLIDEDPATEGDPSKQRLWTQLERAVHGRRGEFG